MTYKYTAIPELNVQEDESPVNRHGDKRGGWNSIPPKVIRTKLKRLIWLSGVPSYKIAGELGFHPTRMSEFCNGKRQIPADHLIKLCEYFDLPAEDIVGFLDEPMETVDLGLTFKIQ